MADEFEHTQFPFFLQPQGRPQLGAEGISEQNEQPAAIEITYRSVGCLGRHGRQMQRALPRFNNELDVAVATHKTIDLVVHPQVYKLKRDMGKYACGSACAGPFHQNRRVEENDETPAGSSPIP